MLLMWYRPVARNRWAYCSFETERSHISTEEGEGGMRFLFSNTTFHTSDTWCQRESKLPSVTDPSSGRRAGGCTKGCDTLLEPHPPWMLWMWFPEALTGKTSDRLKWSASLSSGLPPERLPGSKEKDSDCAQNRPFVHSVSCTKGTPLHRAPRNSLQVHAHTPTRPPRKNEGKADIAILSTNKPQKRTAQRQ